MAGESQDSRPRAAATTRLQYRVLLDTYVYPTLGDMRLDRISVDDVNKWYDQLAPGRERVRAHAYSLLRTILTSAASERPHPLVPYNPAHIRGAGNTKRAHQVQPASLEELQTIVEELPNRYGSWRCWRPGARCASASSRSCAEATWICVRIA